MSRDTIAEILTFLRNADMDKKGTVRIASTKITESVVKILLREGVLENSRKHRENNKSFLVSTLRHRRNRKGTYRKIFKRISRPGLRIYSNYQCIPRICCGMGMAILSTSRGIMTDREARLEGIGGEVLCYIW
uniref:ribosomal protein S8 n=1 Tax=Cananga odorata TaxID=13393 RepID=UPI001EDF5A47|nr:ribosomal protein S8 [Cananga odorata]YP_010275963.1 ribosomal protein S8 [Cananga odorata]UKH49844.1 ribosomal protein S8 [Cananga odorata]UKH49877.1 ribosomal protein S8 [Cananga odorata]